MEQEALLFAEQNGHAAPLSAGIKLRAKVVGGDAPSKAFVAATNRVGLSLNYDSMQLSGVHPMELYRISRDNPARLPGWRRYVYPIYTTYNGKCRKDALPMKF